MKVIILAPDCSPRLINVNFDPSLSNCEINGKSFITNDDIVHKEPWPYAYAVFYNAADTQSKVLKLQNFINRSGFDYDKTPMHGPLVFVKKKFTRICECSQLDLADIQLVPPPSNGYYSYCLVM
jgi:hypothetical protein